MNIVAVSLEAVHTHTHQIVEQKVKTAKKVNQKTRSEMENME